MAVELPNIADTRNGPMAVGSSPSLLANLLEAYEIELIAAGAPLRDWLQPGLDRVETVRKLNDAGLAAPQELVIWYGWHNGAVESPTQPLARRALPRFTFGSIERVVARYRQGVDFINSPAFESMSLDRESYEWGAGEGWLRIVDDNYGCAVDCTGPAGQAPRLHYATEDFGMPGSESLYQAVSLCTLVTWWIDGLRNGAYQWNAENQWWDEDTSLLPASQIAAHFG
jgi:hypothetical protein